MFKELSLKTKFLIPILSLITILFFLGSIILIFNYKKIVALNELKEKILVSNAIADTLHSLQKERGLSSGFVSNTNNEYKIELISQRNITNNEIQKLSSILEKISSDKFQKETLNILQKLKKLNSLRDEVDSFSLSSSILIQKYTELNTELLSIITNISVSSHIPIITKNIMAYSNFLYLKEHVGIQRALGVIILSDKKSDQSTRIHFISLMAIQKHNEAIFLLYAADDFKSYYEEIRKMDFFCKVSDLENVIIEKNTSKASLSSKYWYVQISKKLDALDKLSKYIKIDTTAKIDQKLNDSKRVYIITIVLLLLSLGVFILMLIAFFRLAKEERRLRIVMDKYIISSITNLDGKITDVSEAFCNISGYTRSELIGKNHNIVRHPDMPKSTFNDLWKTIKRGDSWRGKVKNLKSDGNFYWVYANVEPLYDSKGIIDEYISIRLDITESELLLLKIQEKEEKSRVQEELMRQQHGLAQMGEMLSMIAHQWRQPLSAISATAGVINLKSKLNKLDKETALELSSKIKNFSFHLSSTVDDFRNFFKSDKRKNSTNFKTLVESVMQIVESSLLKHTIEVKVDIVSVEEFSTYDNELKQVILNLIKNAEDALIENFTVNPKIEIIVDKRILTVSDNAGGIPHDIIEKIFEPYFSTKLQKDGTGLGLYMSKLIVEGHCSGKLSVTNNINGASFKIVLGENDD